MSGHLAQGMVRFKPSPFRLLGVRTLNVIHSCSRDISISKGLELEIVIYHYRHYIEWYQISLKTNFSYGYTIIFNVLEISKSFLWEMLSE